MFSTRCVSGSGLNPTTRVPTVGITYLRIWDKMNGRKFLGMKWRRNSERSDEYRKVRFLLIFICAVEHPAQYHSSQQNDIVLNLCCEYQVGVHSSLASCSCVFSRRTSRVRKTLAESIATAFFLFISLICSERTSTSEM